MTRIGFAWLLMLLGGMAFVVTFLGTYYPRVPLAPGSDVWSLEMSLLVASLAALAIMAAFAAALYFGAFSWWI